MAAWKDVEQAEPEFAARVRRLFDAGRHKTIATLRADGSPRISGIECEFAISRLWFLHLTSDGAMRVHVSIVKSCNRDFTDTGGLFFK